MIPEALLGTKEFNPIEPVETSASETLGQEDFLRMLIAQLENQDPLNPQDASEFTAQLATFSTLEQLIAMRSGIDTLVETQTSGEDSGISAAESLDRALGASNLIGHEIVARGSQIQLDPEGPAPVLGFDLLSTSQNTAVDILNRNGVPVARLELGARDQGVHETFWDGTDAQGNTLPPGIYSFRIDADHLGETVAAQTFIRGPVTATQLGAEQPALFLGDVVVPLTDVFEVRERSTGS